MKNTPGGQSYFFQARRGAKEGPARHSSEALNVQGSSSRICRNGHLVLVAREQQKLGRSRFGARYHHWDQAAMIA